jgi:hypothetical protein
VAQLLNEPNYPSAFLSIKLVWEANVFLSGQVV